MENDETNTAAADPGPVTTPENTPPGFAGASTADDVADQIQGGGTWEAPADPAPAPTEDPATQIQANVDTLAPVRAPELVDVSADGPQTIAADNGSVTFGAEIPGGAAALAGGVIGGTSPSSPTADARTLARETLQELALVERAISEMEARKSALRDDLAAQLERFGPDADDQRLVTPFGSASLSDAPRRVKIFGTIPNDYMKSVPDEKKIGDSLRAGNVVNGAELSNGGSKVVRVTWPKSES